MDNLDLKKNRNNFEKYRHIPSIDCSSSPIVEGNIFITIAIPTYKRAELLNEAIKSVLAQKNINNYKYEIIIVDNESFSCGDTETTNLMKNFMEDSRIRYYRNEQNIGMVGNWNRCFELARGEWVALLHDDDMLKSNYLDRVNYFINKKKNIGCLCVEKEYIGVRKIKAENFKKIKNKAKNKLYKIRIFDSFITNLDIYGAPTCGTIFRKKNILDTGGFDDLWGGSSDWFGCLNFNNKYNVYKTIEPLGLYRWEINESFNIKTQKAFINEKKILRLYFKHNNLFMKLWTNFFEDAYNTIALRYAFAFFDSIGQLNEKDLFLKKYQAGLYDRKYKVTILDFIINWYMRIKKFINILFG